MKEVCGAIRVGEGQHLERKRRELKDRAQTLTTLTLGAGRGPQGDAGQELLSMTNNGEFWDDAKGGMLEPSRVKEARKEDIQFVRKRTVYDVVPWEQAQQRTGRPPIRTRWVDTNKGDTSAPNYRSRWVAQEFKTGTDHALYAATPPLETVREVV